MNTAEQDTGTETTMLQQISRLRDEIRVKINLSGKDVRDLWENLEPKVHDFERKVHEAGDRVVGELQKVGDQLRTQLNHLVEKLKR